MHRVTGEGVEVGGQRRHQGLALPGSHLRNLALVEGHAADQLHVEMAHAKHSFTRFPGDRKRLGQYLVQTFTGAKPLPELACPGRESGVVEGFHVCGEGIDLLHHFAHPLQFPVIAGTE